MSILLSKNALFQGFGFGKALFVNGLVTQFIPHYTFVCAKLFIENFEDRKNRALTRGRSANGSRKEIQ